MKRFLVLIIVALLSWSFADGGSSSTTEVASTDLEKVQALVDAESYSEAINLLKVYLASENDNADYHNLMGFSLRKTDDFEGSLEHYFKALELDPEHLGANEYLGELYLMLDDLENAQSQLEALVSFGCDAGCEQYDMLAQRIDTYNKTGSADW